MKCPNCGNEMVQSRAGWLCLSCGHVEAKPSEQVANSKITLGKDSHAQMAISATDKPEQDKSEPVGPPPTNATPKLDTISAPEPKADEPPPTTAPPWADTKPNDDKKDATSPKDNPNDDAEKTPDVTQPDDIAAVQEAVKEVAGEVKPDPSTPSSDQSPTEETKPSDDMPADKADEKAPTEETPPDNLSDNEPKPPAQPDKKSAEPEEPEAQGEPDTTQPPEEPQESEDTPAQPPEPAEPEPAQSDESDDHDETEPPTDEVADTPEENPKPDTDTPSSGPPIDQPTEPDASVEPKTEPADDNMPGLDVPPRDPDPESEKQAESDTEPQAESNPEPGVNSEPEPPEAVPSDKSAPDETPSPDPELEPEPAPEPAPEPEPTAAPPAADPAPPESPSASQTPSDNPPPETLAPAENPPSLENPPPPEQPPAPPAAAKPPLTPETHPKKKRKFHLFSVSLVAGLAIGASGLAIFAATVGPKLALASYASKLSGSKTMAFAASVNNVSAGYQFALKLNGTTDLRQATQPKVAATVSGNVAQAAAPADLPIGGQLTANLITAGQQLFFKLTSVSLHSQVVGLAPSATWYGLDLGSSSDAKCLSKGTSSDSLLSSNGLSSIPVSSASLVGLSSLNASPALHYRGTLDPSKLTASNLSADCKSMLASLKTSRLTYNLWRGWSQDRLTLAVAGGSTITLDTSAYNRPVAIAVPTGAQNAADLFSNVLGASTVAPSVAKAAVPSPTPAVSSNQPQTVKADLAAYLAAYRAQAQNGFFPTNPSAVTPAGITGTYAVITSKPTAPGQLYYQAGGVCAAPSHTPGRTATRYLALTALAADGTPVCLDSTHN